MHRGGHLLTSVSLLDYTAHVCSRMKPRGLPVTHSQPDCRGMNLALMAGQGLVLESEGSPDGLDGLSLFLEDLKSQEDV